MVHVKRVELTNFKSFGGTTSVPLLPGFTVISGPNGSGKSNILDALLFCLGLASSKGMRADRLPDLVNNAQKPKGRGAVEAIVTVTFDLADEAVADQVVEVVSEEQDEAKPPSNPSEWSVTRKLRVTHQGSYTSSYYINGVSCTLTDLHEELETLRIYPEGYNVVLQGDVTSIISMNPRERREIIDELAGVAGFDRKIHQAKGTLDEVKEKEDSCRIIENELTVQRDRLSLDRTKAEKYQKLRIEYQSKQSWEAVLSWRGLQTQQEQLVTEIQNSDRSLTEFSTELIKIKTEIDQQNALLEQLNIRVKALGEEELLSLQATLATQEAERKQVQHQQQELATSLQEGTKRLLQVQQDIEKHQISLDQAVQEQILVNSQVAILRQERDTLQEILDQSRQEASEIASASEVWVQEQSALTKQIESLLQILEPQRTEQAQLQERTDQLAQLIQEQSQLVANLQPELMAKQADYAQLAAEFATLDQPIQNLATNLSATDQELQIQQETQKRLLQEQREKQRQLDKLEAMSSAQQEVQGTQASKVILQSGMPGLCGLVVQLGRVEPQYQLALEISAGGRLGHIVVEDDSVAAIGIELLKQKRAGRATFLPLNKIRAPKLTLDATLRFVDGFVDYAVNLVECDRRYQEVFDYVFGNTVVFATLAQARKNLGLYRIVTLEGELLETSGAMTGGSNSQRSGLRFGTPEAGESEEVIGLKSRLQDIERILERCMELISTLTINSRRLTQELTDGRQMRREKQLHLEQLQKEIKSLAEQLSATSTQLAQNQEKSLKARSRLQILEQELPAREAELHNLRQSLAELEADQTPSEWQKIQAAIKDQEQQLQSKNTAFREAEQKMQSWENQQQRLQERIQSEGLRVGEYQQEQKTQQSQLDQVRYIWKR